VAISQRNACSGVRLGVNENWLGMFTPVKKPLQVALEPLEVAVAATKPLPSPIDGGSLIKSDSQMTRRLGVALASIPIYQNAYADAPPAFTEIGLRYSQFQEDALPESQLIFGSPRRYDIDVTQLWFETPVGGSWSIAMDLQNDSMSGASPWFVGTNLDGQPGVIMSGASIHDNRVEVGVTTRYFWADGNAGFNVSQSKEDDYEAQSVSFDVAWNSDDNSRTWTASASSSNDTVRPVKENIPVFIDQEGLNTQSTYFGVSQILSSTAIARIGLGYTISKGYLSDPYKLNDARPDRHERISLSGGYRRYFIEQRGALHVDYRYYHDSWGTNSHTAELAWHQDIKQHSLKPYIRYYRQGGAEFFRSIADVSQPVFADDYRLSAYDATTMGLHGFYQLGDWRFEAQVERYKTSATRSPLNVESAPALVDFWRGTVGITWRFD